MKKEQTSKVKGLRRCVGCRLMFEKHELIRVAKKNDGSYFIDKTGKPYGRGAYVCFNAKCVSRAAKTSGVERSFGQKDKLNNVTMDVNSIYEHLAMEIEEIER